jgi:thymidylate synthase
MKPITCREDLLDRYPRLPLGQEIHFRGFELQYLAAMRQIFLSGEPHADRTGVGTLSLFGTQLRHDMRIGFPLLTTKKMPLESIFNELVWFLSGSTNVFDLPENTQKWWTPWADEYGALGPIYGRQLRDARSFDAGGKYTVDQLRQLVNMLDTQPNSRRLIMSTWNAADVQHMRLPCCHGLVIQFKTHEGDKPGLSLSTYQRSADHPVGVPVNLASYSLLLLMLAWATRREARDVVYSFGDYHIYDNQHDGCFEQLGRELRKIPRVAITLDRDTFDDSFEALMSIRWEHIELTNYDPHPAIKFPVAV